MRQNPQIETHDLDNYEVYNRHSNLLSQLKQNRSEFMNKDTLYLCKQPEAIFTLKFWVKFPMKICKNKAFPFMYLTRVLLN